MAGLKRVLFIGSGYEYLKSVIVQAETNAEAFEKAESMYDCNGWSFVYCEMEVEDL